MPTYATAADLAALLGTAAPANADRLLDRASRVIGQATVTATYAAGTDGLPTDADVLAAMRDATCEQAAWWIASGEDEGMGTAAAYSSVSIGSVSLTRAQSGGSAASGAALAPQAYAVLSLAGLVGTGPWAC